MSEVYDKVLAFALGFVLMLLALRGLRRVLR